LGHGQWDIPKLRLLLEKIIPERGVMEGYEVEHEFPGIGSPHDMLERPPKCSTRAAPARPILLGMQDVTERRNLEREK